MPMLENDVDEVQARVIMVEFMLQTVYGLLLAQMPGAVAEETKRALLEQLGVATPDARHAFLDNRRYKMIAGRAVELAPQFFEKVSIVEDAYRLGNAKARLRAGDGDAPVIRC